MQSTAYSYIRFSTPEQTKGDSLRRQTEAAAEWCRRHKVALDASTTLHDLGRSAYTGAHRKNPDRHALATFLKLVEAGKVPRGSHLIIENLDRLSREHIRPALTLLLNLIEAGVRVVQLKPVEQIYDEDVEPMVLMMAIMELSRGNSESRMKSERVGDAWAERKRRAREEGQVLTRRLPAWVEEADGKLHLIPDRAAAVLRIYHLAGAGYGHGLIVQRLDEEGIPSFGPAGRWTRAYVQQILGDRRPVGEYQPRGRGGKADGDPIAGYLPPAVTEAEWQAARHGSLSRRNRRGRNGGRVNLFSAMVRDAHNGQPYHVGLQTCGGSGGGSRPVLRTRASVEGRSGSRTFPLEVFERAIISMLAEIDPRVIMDQPEEPDKVMSLSAELELARSRATELEQELLKGDVAALAKVLRQLEARIRELSEELARARTEAANPAAEAWGECKSLLATLDAAADQKDARLRLRAALRKVIDQVWVLVVPRGWDRLAAVQLWFSGGQQHRDYLIFNRRGREKGTAPRQGGWWVRSFADAAMPGDLDLRKPAHAKQLEAALLAADLPG